VGGAPGEGRYNLHRRNRLPKFNEAKNPFAPADAPEPEKAVLPSGGEVRTVAPETAATQPSVQPAQTQRIPALADQPMAQVSRAQGVKAGLQQAAGAGWRQAAALSGKLMNFVRKLVAAVSRREPRPLIPRFGKPAVQTELRLDNVRVVRNDLEESDLEIVVAETATQTQLAPKSPVPAPNRGPMPTALKKLTGRVIRGGKT
jgi:hypothetical protein